METKKLIMKRGEYYVYVYLDPRKQGKYKYGEHNFLHEPIYVGKGKGKRFRDIRGRNSLLDNKINVFGKPIILFIGKKLTENKAFELEKELIKTMGRKDLDGPLCNFTDGGEGVRGHHHSEETKKKMSIAKIGRILSEEHKIKIGLAGKGRISSEETKKKLSIANTGNIVSKETREKLSKKITQCWENGKYNHIYPSRQS